MGELANYIMVIKNIVPDTLCDRIISEYKNSTDWIKAETRGGVRKDVRNCATIAMSEKYIIGDNSIRQEIDSDLFKIAGKCIDKYRHVHINCVIDEDTGYELLRYKEGGFYTQHTDTFIHAPRLVSCSLNLNNDYEGGEFAFFDKGLKYKLNKGDVIMFPSTFMYPHEIMPVTKGTRYSIITWFR